MDQAAEANSFNDTRLLFLSTEVEEVGKDEKHQRGFFPAELKGRASVSDPRERVELIHRSRPPRPHGSTVSVPNRV